MGRPCPAGGTYDDTNPDKHEAHASESAFGINSLALRACLTWSKSSPAEPTVWPCVSAPAADGSSHDRLDSLIVVVRRSPASLAIA